jgi:predicted site-specific integrase-resolvase
VETPKKVDLTKLVSVAEYARRNYVTKKTVYNWIAEGKIKKIEIDKLTFILLE